MANFKTAWNAFWTIFKSDELAKAWNDIVANPQPALPPAEPKSEPIEPQEETPSPTVKSTVKGEAVHTLAILQRESRLIDFLQEDIAPYTNEQIRWNTVTAMVITKLLLLPAFGILFVTFLWKHSLIPHDGLCALDRKSVV